MNFKKAFKDAQDYHIHAIENGSPETRAAHMAHHHKSGNYELLVKAKKPQKGTTT